MMYMSPVTELLIDFRELYENECFISQFFRLYQCRSDNLKMTSCYVVDAGFKTISDNLISDGSFTYLPFYPGHLYIMYRGNGKEVDKVKGFQTEVDLRKHLLDYYGTPQISGGEITDWSLVFSPTVSFTEFMIIFGTK